MKEEYMLSPNIFYEMPKENRNNLIAFYIKAKNIIGENHGFSGEIIFLDNGEGVYPRLIAAKFPRWKENLPPVDRATQFLRELKLQASAYYHPNVHWPFDVAFAHGVPIAYFRRWEGDLSNFIEDKTFGDLGRLSLMVQLIDGLVHCHSRGLVHQDLKPENIFVRDLSVNFSDLPKSDLWLRPLVADFGSVNLSKVAGIFSGSRPYMAPEQWQKAPLGEWTSVFVVGVILHELMSRGVHPIGEHSGDWHRVIRPFFNRWQQNDFWKRWSASGCPVAKPFSDISIAAVVAACLSTDWTKRPTLREVQESLFDILMRRSETAAIQVKLFLEMAKYDSSVNGWSHFSTRIKHLEYNINEYYNESAPV